MLQRRTSTTHYPNKMAISLTNLTDKDKQFLQQQKAQGIDAKTAFANLSAKQKKEKAGGVFKTIFGGIKDVAVDTAKAYQEGVDRSEEQRQEIQQLQQSGEIGPVKAFGLYGLNTLNKMIQPTSQAAFELTAGTGKKVLDKTTEPLQGFLTKFIGEKNIDSFQKKVFDTPVANRKVFGSGEPGENKDLVSLNEAYNNVIKKYSELDPATKATVDNILTSLDSVGTLAGAFGVGTVVGKTGQVTNQAFKESLGALKSKFGVPETATMKETFNGLKGAINQKVTGALPNVKTPTSVAGLDIRPAENILEAATELEKKGFEKPFVEFLQNATPDDQNAFKKMLGLAEKNAGEFKVTTRPIEVPGEELTGRAKFLFDERNKAGALKDTAIKSMPDKPINITQSYDDFLSSLESKGIKIKDDGSLDFRRSTLSGAQDNSMKSLITDLANDLRPNTAGDVLRTPARIDEIRQKLFSLLDLGKKQGTLPDAATALLENVRKTLKNPLDELSSQLGLNYTEAAEAYAKYTESLGEFTKLLGYKGNIEGLTQQSLRAGEVLNRILGNASARPNEVLQKLVDLTTELGYKGGNPLEQVQFADMLENIFGTTQTRGLKGEVNRGVGMALEGTGLAKDAATMNLGNLTDKAIRKIFGITKEKQINALKSFFGMLDEGKTLSSVSPEDLKGFIEQINSGGITQDLLKKESLGGTKTYAFSPFVKRTQVFNKQVSTVELANFIEANKDLLSKEGFALGGWYDTETGKVYLDVSVTTPDLEKAMTLAEKFNQKAIFDLNDFTEIATGGNGEVTKSLENLSTEDIMKILNSQ